MNQVFKSVKVFIWAIPIALIVFTVFRRLNVQAQQAQNTSPPQVTGAPGSPDATITIDGKQLPAPAEKFGGVIRTMHPNQSRSGQPQSCPPRARPTCC